MPNKKTSLPSSIDHKVALLGTRALASTPFAKRRGPEFAAAIEAGCKKRLAAARKTGGLVDVMALGKVMKRKPFIFLMRYQSKYFDAVYFDSYR